MAMHSTTFTSVAAPELDARSVEIVQWPLPDFTGPTLERLYHSTFCSLPHLFLHGSIGPSTQGWVERCGGEIIALLLFEIRRGCAYVINEVVDLDAGTLHRFSQTLFLHHPVITAVALHAVAVAALPSTVFSQCAAVSEDYVLNLPGSEAAYLASLKRQTQEKIRYYQARCRRKQPSMQFRITRGAYIDAGKVNAVIQFNRARMVNKGRPFAMDEGEQHRLLSLMQQCGLIAVIEIDSQVRAGLLCTQMGRDLYLHVIAHDPQYDDLNLGFLCCYMGIRSAIEQGCVRFHFLWGRSDYKPRFGGRPKPLLAIALYKSRLHALLHPQLFFGQLRQAIRQRLKTLRHRWHIQNIRQSQRNNAA